MDSAIAMIGYGMLALPVQTLAVCVLAYQAVAALRRDARLTQREPVVARDARSHATLGDVAA
ncbi:MAG TPA: hypothetical protein VIS07_07355 [Candidatus Binatia bacterium]